ncbi:MAG: hypothetical protein HGA45_39910 [Chloroflexales bacterium]|nr:hypothetical protein [Chloroflexales bacterium]
MPRASAGSTIVLVSGATTTVARFVGHPALGRLVQPRSYNRIEPIAQSGMPWGADNDALAGVNPDAYLRMLDAIARAPRDQLKFVAAPDAVERTPEGIVGSWEGTRWLWRCWRPALIARGLPAAIVLQDGATPDTVPWDELSAVFVGASTRWKLSRTAELLVRMARARGLWTHIGRVNTFGRLARVEAMGAHSFDGSQFSRWPEKYLPRFLARLEYQQQPMPEVPRAAP